MADYRQVIASQFLGINECDVQFEVGGEVLTQEEPIMELAEICKDEEGFVCINYGKSKNN